MALSFSLGQSVSALIPGAVRQCEGAASLPQTGGEEAGKMGAILVTGEERWNQSFYVLCAHC